MILVMVVNLRWSMVNWCEKHFCVSLFKWVEALRWPLIRSFFARLDLAIRFFAR